VGWGRQFDALLLLLLLLCLAACVACGVGQVSKHYCHPKCSHVIMLHDHSPTVSNLCMCCIHPAGR
jgi:hypothetical protein